MRFLAKMVLFTTAGASLMACQPSPNASENTTNTGKDNTPGSSIGVDVGVNKGVDTDGKTSDSTSTGTAANSELTINAGGTIYTYGQIKKYFSCVAANSPNAAFKSTSAETVDNLNKADASADPKDDKTAYSKAALGISAVQGYSGSSCTP